MKATFSQIFKSVFCCILHISVFLCGASDAFALNDITVRLYDQRELVAGNYTTFCNDASGFLWIGTDAGLLRFDGNHSDVYRNEESDSCSLSDNKIVSLFSDSRGNTWVGTVNGLNCYDRGSDTFRLVALPGMAFNGYITDIAELSDGKLLFLVGGVGLFTLNIDDLNKEGSRISPNPFKIADQDGREVSRLIRLKDGAFVFACRGGDIYKFYSEGKPRKIGSVSGNIRHIVSEDDKSVLISTQYECYRLDLNSGDIRRLIVEGNDGFKVTDMFNYNGVTYIATAASGVWEVGSDADVISHSKRLHSSTLNLPLLKIGSVYVDNSGNLWMGCNHKGVAIAPSSNGPFSNKSLNSILKELGGEVISMTVADGQIILGTNSGDLLLLNPDGSLKRVSVSPGNLVTSLAVKPDGNVLVGMAREGIWELNPKSLALSRIVKPEQKYPGVMLSVGKDGQVVAAFSELGVLRYDPATRNEKWFYPVNGSNLLSCFYYAGVSATSDGKVWIGGYSGLSCYDPNIDALMPIDQTPFLKSVVYDICDFPGGVMIATSKGLVQYNAKNGIVRKFTTADGLPDNEVRTLQRDGNGGVWAGSMKGLAYLKDAGEKIRTFGGKYGLPPTSYVFSHSMGNSRDLLVANYENLVVFNPDSVKQSEFGGEVKITGLYLNGNRLTEKSLSGKTHIVDGPIDHPERLHLSSKDNSLVLRLSTLDFRDASDLRYEWQLDGDGDSWHSSSAGESLIYLPPLKSGRHTLRVRGWENDVVSDVTELKLDVKAPWYLSNMAYATYLLIFVMIGGLIYKVVKNRRDEELYETKIRYFMDISHELRSPVTLMLSPVETLLKQSQSPETTSQLLTMRRNGQRVLNLVDQLLDLRKIEKGKMRLVYTEVDIKTFVAELVEMFKPMAEEKKQTLSFVCEDAEIKGKVDCNNLDKILVNLISNAIKYTPDGGSIEVGLRKTVDLNGVMSYCVTVTDTGIGLDNKVISHLFERFYRNREFHHGNASGFGIGLDLCTRLVELHKGSISAKNREDGIKGSVFSVTLPLIIGKTENEIQNADTKRRQIPAFVASQGPAVKASKSGHRFRIMVVDDDRELREYIKECLGTSYKVVTMPDA